VLLQRGHRLRKVLRMQSDRERTDIFLSSLEKSRGVFLDELEEKALDEGVPIIKKPVQGLLRVLLEAKKPERVLEIGTAVGFSALFMIENGPQNMVLTTIEDFERRFEEAERNIKASGHSERIRLIFGDANEVLKTLEGGFDLIFMDAAKAQYINYLPEVMRLLNRGGLLMADNCLQDGDILESKFIVERRNRTIHKRMREFLTAVYDSEELESTLLSIGDGVCVCVKK